MANLGRKGDIYLIRFRYGGQQYKRSLKTKEKAEAEASKNSVEADLGRGARRHDPWLQIIPCIGARGHVFPWGGDMLAASVDKPRLVKPLMALGCCELVQDGDDGATVTFAVSDFPRVAAI